MLCGLGGGRSIGGLARILWAARKLGSCGWRDGWEGWSLAGAGLDAT